MKYIFSYRNVPVCSLQEHVQIKSKMPRTSKHFHLSQLHYISLHVSTAKTEKLPNLYVQLLQRNTVVQKSYLII